jgi:hypothetical protein
LDSESQQRLHSRSQIGGNLVPGRWRRWEVVRGIWLWWLDDLFFSDQGQGY